MMVMAALAIPINENGACLLVYAVAAGCFTTSLRRVALLVTLDVAVLGCLFLPASPAVAFWVSMLLLIIIVGFMTHNGCVSHCAAEKLRVANDEIEHLAKVAERERIARDLHDLLGHTLSLITLKAELARKLVDRDPQRAKQEMQDVEQTSRAALADVREAISGYRGQGLATELMRARQTLETAGIAVDCAASEVPLSPAQESVLALALREAVTNVVRHAQAQRCSVRLAATRKLARWKSPTTDAAPTLPKATVCVGCASAWRPLAARCSARPRPEPAWSFICLSRPLPPLCETESVPAAKRDKIRVVLAEDQAMVLGALAALLEMEDDIEVIARARNGDEALRTVQQARPDVFITDIEMPTLTGLEVAAELKRRACRCASSFLPPSPAPDICAARSRLVRQDTCLKTCLRSS